MVKHDKKKRPRDRDTTDEGLRIERRKTDTELAGNQRLIKRDADTLVAESRQRADTLIQTARDREDRTNAAAGSSNQLVRDLGDERAREDAALIEQRGGADASARDERSRSQLALASLLAFERHDTDLRLQIERTRADQASRSREDFLAIVSHDLRTLAGGIEVSADLLRMLATAERSDSSIARYAESIQRFSGLMNRLIGDLMDIASIEAGKLSVIPEWCDAAATVRDSIEAFLPVALSRDIQLTCQIGPDVGLVELDRDRILQVLTNLVGNALKFTANGGQISIRVDKRATDIYFSVADTGEGVPHDRLDRIFERYYQAHRPDRRGLGLGLYIAKSIVEAHCGKIWVESEPGAGSTFFFSLPNRPGIGPPAIT